MIVDGEDGYKYPLDVQEGDGSIKNREPWSMQHGLCGCEVRVKGWGLFGFEYVLVSVLVGLRVCIVRLEIGLR